MSMSVSQLSVFALLTTLVITGCSRESRQVSFEPNLVHAMKYQIQESVPMEQATSDASWVVNKMFGTPDDPKLPDVITNDEALAQVVSIENLQRASGPFEDGRGLYRKHCALCHGVTGNGRGAQAAVLNPYPRDYRMGIFKFKSTKRGSKPTREDMAKLIRDGIAGTAMKKIKELKEEDIQALTDYVIYLSMRGELERALLDLVLDIDIEAGERIIDTQFGKRFQTNKIQMDELAAINEETDADDLLDYEAYLDFAKRLEADAALLEKLKIEEDEAEAAVKSYVSDKFSTSDEILAELNSHLDEPFELEDETTDDLAAELAEALIDRYDDYVDLKEDLESDPKLLEQLEEASRKTSGKELEQFELYVDSWAFAEETVVELAEAWLNAEENVFPVPEPPSTIPVADSYEEFAAMQKGDQAEAMAASIKRGQELFVGKIANCSKCHGVKGRGDGQTNDYDDWTKDWTSRVGLKPEDRESLIPLLARGALPPINARPRNLEDGLYHGGATAADLYRRIMMGIEGTPMPAATFLEGQFEQDDVWHLINFVRSLQIPPEPDAKPAVATQASL